MTGKDIFKIWAPVGEKWTDWVRPVPFVSINKNLKVYEIINYSIPKINYINKNENNTAIILDLPNNESINEGIALAGLGFRPIPIYNGTNEQNGSMAIVNNHAIEAALIWGANEMKKIDIPKNAPPVFLLDSNRMHRFRMSSAIFDNSWDIYSQDMPSAEYFLEKGITNIIIRSEKINKDINKITYDFQKKGIKILFTDGFEEPKAVTIKKIRYIN